MLTVRFFWELPKTNAGIIRCTKNIFTKLA